MEVFAPDVLGIYTLGVEIIPMAPPEGVEWDFTSPLSDEILIYVNQDLGTGKEIPGIQGSYYSIFHFQGEYNDWGEREDPVALYSGFEPDIDVTSGIFGYRMSENTFFESDDFFCRLMKMDIWSRFRRSFLL